MTALTMQPDKTASDKLPPGPPPVPGNIISQLRFYNDYSQDMLANMMQMYDDYGDMTVMQIGKERIYFLSRPEHHREVLVRQAKSFHKGSDYKDTNNGMARYMGNGLVTSDGEFWKRQRKLTQPAFHIQRINAYAEAMVDYTVDMLSTWRDGVTLDVNEEMMRVTLMIVAKTLFDADASADASRVAEVLDIIMEATNAVDFLPNWIPTRAHIQQRRALNDLDEIVYGYINDRRASGEDKGDLLSMLLMAEDEDGNRMTDKQVRDEAVTLYLAGHETTSNAMTWTWYLLQQNPDAEAQLHTELDTVLQGRTPTMADLRNLPYTEMVIKESMRLLPPVFGVARQAIEDVEIDGYTIPAGSGVVLHFYRTHRHAEFWENPEKFDPLRFSPENEKSIPRYAYMPFSSGPRVCIGNSFAMMEAELLLATIAQQYTLRLAPEANVVPDPKITLRPKYGMPMTLHKR